MSPTVKAAAAAALATAVIVAGALFYHHKTTPAPDATQSSGNALPPGCCGQRMEAEGEIYTYTVDDGKTPDGTIVPEDYRTEVFGNVIVVKANLPAGDYRVEVLASENSYTEAGKRVFNLSALYDAAATRAATNATNAANASSNRIELAKNIDLFARAGGAGKPTTIFATLHHPGGTLKLLFTPVVDFPKFSAIRILDAQGNKVAWLFAKDMAEIMKLPGTPPAIAGPLIYKDPAVPLDQRVADLIRRMTLREKVWQLSHDAPEIARLQLPAYNYWSEALHGVARNGVATVFPQAIGMAASFDPDLLHTIGDAIATEGRAKFNAAHAPGAPADEFNGLFRGLTFWSPNINLFRDPRWGRGQETYGEDPLLTGTMGVAFIKGMQGDDPKYYKVIATAKHFAVHSGPELLRHVFNATPPIRDFYESYLPQFEMAVRQGHVASVMGAYNRVYGSPACDSELLLKTLLRDTWGFDGYVVSDCNAISDIWAHHKVVDNQAQAAADAVKSGTDLECGRDYGSLAAAVDVHLLSEKDIDNALSRVLASRFRLGLFDPPASVRYAAIAPAENDSPAHADLALKMARESIVLLKNDGTLPLKKEVLKKLAVIGPNADGLLPLLGNYNGTPSHPVTIVAGLRAALPNTQIIHIKASDNARRDAAWQACPDILVHPTGSPGETGFRAEFFDSAKMDSPAIATRIEKTIDFHGLLEWTIVPAVAPAAGSPVTPPAAIRFSADFVAPRDGQYRIGVNGTNGYRFFVNNQKLADLWDTGADPTTMSAIGMNLKAGQTVPLIVEARPNAGLLNLTLLWDDSDQRDLAPEVVARIKDCDAIIYAGGLDAHMEAEEGDIRAYFKHFIGGDRETIELPDVQTHLLQALAATGKPVVFVNLSGSAIAMPWEAQHLNAIVQAWYPGESGGTAVADVLTGAFNPAGRLPVTFYAATEDLPDFTDYAMAPGPRAPLNGSAMPASKGRTYRYFTGQPLFPFGHGLSYTQFHYANFSVSPASNGADTLTVALDVTNTGAIAGDEVVQFYARPKRPPAAASGDPQQILLAFRRVPLAAGENTHLAFAIPLQALRVWNETKNQYELPAQAYTLHAAASSADLRASADFTTR